MENPNPIVLGKKKNQPKCFICRKRYARFMIKTMNLMLLNNGQIIDTVYLCKPCFRKISKRKRKSFKL